jgi:hypothetical protein
MGYKSGGLSYFEDGGSSDVDESTTQPTPSVNIGGKGKKAVIANEGVLQAMQDLYTERAARHGGFMEAMKDAQAWWSGGVQGPGAALAKRDEQRMKQAAELFSIQQQIAAQRNAMEARDRFLGKAPPAAAEGTSGVTAAQAQQGVAAINQQTGGLLDLVKDQSLKQQIGAQYLSDPDKAMGQLNTYLSKRAEETPLQKNLRYAGAPVEQGGLGVPASQLPAMAITNISGPAAFTPQDVRTARGTVQTTPIAEAGKLAAPPGVGGPAAPSAAAPKPLPQAQAQPPQGAPAPGGQPPMAGGQPPAQAPAPRPAAPKPAPAAAAPAPVAPPAPPAPAAAPGGIGTFGFAPGSKEALELQQKGGEAVIEGRKSEAVETGKDLALQRAGTVEAGSSAPEQLARIDYLEQMVNNPKTRDAFGVLQKPGVMAAIQTMLSEGVSLATLGPVGFKGLEDAITKLGGTQEQIDARQKAAREFALMQLQNAKTLLKGQGAVSDAERKLVADMSGNVGKSPNAIKDLLAWSRIRTNYDQKNGAAYSEFIRRNPNASFQEYRNSPLYQQIKDEYISNLQTFTRASARSVTKQPHPAESLLDKYAPRKK